MANLRIIYDNAADRATSLSASTTAGSLVAANMQNDVKGKVHRSTGTSVTYTLTWTTAETFGGLVLPMTNLFGDSTIRVRAYDATVGGTLLLDSGTVNAAPGLALGLWDWAQPLNANAFAYGGFSKTGVWFDNQVQAKRVVVDLVDTNNPAGYIDCARIVAGAYWEPSVQADYGVKESPKDSTGNDRNEAGDNVSDAGYAFSTLSLDLKLMTETDRAYLRRIFTRVGTRKNVALSVLPGNGNSTQEQDYSVYGKRQNSELAFDFFDSFSNTLTMESW